ncbi:hypothetical protein [Arthrobacter sp. VKM Ac-2550]|uniref:hypothetical protein n=1 Tax=Crystallibacter permensis TaxID=1938888 RepID=UPI0022275887|nr:hypothetical protein [Arthrobacter sp. VKM Ac-2550]MCW2135012.1 hypothetical protein [Arthrobacter sp. VKM Ac-2550]
MARTILDRFDVDTEDRELRVKALGPSDRPNGPTHSSLEIIVDDGEGSVRIELGPDELRQLVRVAQAAAS